MSGDTPPDGQRTFHVYFDKTGRGFAPPAFTDQVVRSDVIDAYSNGTFDSFRFDTPGGTYVYHKNGGGFAKLIDPAGNDWISYRHDVTNAGGTWRGIPNFDDTLHPGFNFAATTAVASGPLKETFRTISHVSPGTMTWEVLWEIYPTYAKLIVLQAHANYWFLYEGTPGGLLETGAGKDFYVLSDGTQQSAGTVWPDPDPQDLPNPEWVYFADPGVGRALYLVNHQHNDGYDSYRTAGSGANNMTVFGFGRQRSGTGYKGMSRTQLPAYFTIGLMDQTAYQSAAEVINGAYQDLAIQTGAVSKQVDAVGNGPSLANPISVIMVADRTLTANFVPARHTLTVNQVGSGTVTIDPQQAQYEFGELVTLTAQPAAGWLFDGWDGSLSGGGNPVELLMDGDKTVTAVFVPAYTLNVNVVGAGGEVQMTPQQPVYVAGDVVTLTAISEPGWTFTGWSGAISGSSPTVEVTMDGNKTITATFVRNEYTLAIMVPTGGGSVKREPAKEKYFYDDEVTVTAEAQSGWTFTGWSGALSGDGNPQSLLITGDTTLQATFAQTAYTVSTNVVGSGSIVLAPDQAFYPLGAEVMVTALPTAGWTFSGWSGDLNGTDAQATLTVNGNQSVTATFAPLAPTLTVNTNGNGTATVNPLKATYQYKETVTLTATPATGWFFTGWSGDLSGDANPVSVELDGNKSIIANFAQTTGMLTTQVVGQGQLLVNPLKTLYAPGEEVELLAVPDLDWQFAGWSGALSGEGNPAILVMNGNQSVTATFSEAPATGEIKSDDFNLCAYSTSVWTWIDPLGDASPPQLTGEEILLAVPGGVTHDFWRDGIQAPHLVQQVDDQDFAVMAQFNSAVSERIQMQGLLFKEDENRAVRVNFQREGSTTYLFVGVLRGAQSSQARAKIALAGEAPLALRVQRTDNQWAFWYRSGAGEWVTEEALSFTHALVVKQVGLFVGNANVSGNPAPAHTAVVDYFVNLAQPLAGDDPRANVLPVEVVGQGEITRNVACGNPVELTATPAAGWEFEQWEARTPQGIQNLGNANPLRLEFTKGMTVTAVFNLVDPVSYQLNVTMVGQGAVTKAPDKASYAPGETVTLTAQAQLGWHFVGWSGDMTGTAAQVQVTMEKDLSIQVTFAADPQSHFTVATSVIGNGSVTLTPAKAQYEPGEVVNAEAKAGPGWAFIEWSGDLSGAENAQSLTVDANKSVTATFQATKAGFIVSSPNGKVKVEPDKERYEVGEEVTLTAESDDGWEFVEWQINEGVAAATLNTSANPLTVTIDGQKTYQPKFREQGSGSSIIVYLPVIFQP